MHPYGFAIVSNDAFVVRPTAIRNTMRMYVTRFPMIRNGEPWLIIAGVRMPVTDRCVVRRTGLHWNYACFDLRQLCLLSVLMY